MLLLPKKIGAITLMRRLDGDGISESYAAILDSPPGRQVRVRRMAPALVADPALASAVRARVQDLAAVSAPAVSPVMESFNEGDDVFIREAWTDSLGLDEIIATCKATGVAVPPHVFLHIAGLACNALDALHTRPGRATGAEHTLHLHLRPAALRFLPDGTLLVDRFGWLRSPLDAAGASIAPEAALWLAPEQVTPDGEVGPATDIYSLGATLTSFLALGPVVAATDLSSAADQIARGQVDPSLRVAGELVPGVERVLYRAMSVNPRHRYPRTFAFREDLRALGAGYSFAAIEQDLRAFLDSMRGAPSLPAAGAGTLVDLLDAPEPRAKPSTLSTLVPEEPDSFVGRPITDEVVTQSGVSEAAQVPDPADGTGWVRQAPASAAAEPAASVQVPGLDAPPKAAPAPAAPRPKEPDLDDDDEPGRGAGGAVVAAGAFAVVGVGAAIALVLVGIGVLWWMSQPGAPTTPSSTTASVADVDPGDPAAPAEEPAAEAPAEAEAPAAPQAAPQRAATPPPTERAASSDPVRAPAAASTVRAPRETYTPPEPMPPVPKRTTTPATTAALATIAPAPLATAAEVTTLQVDEVPASLQDLSAKARTGALTADDVNRLEAVRPSEPDYTRANVILYQHAKAKDDNRARARYLASIMSIPENQYNPQFLVEEAELAIRKKDWETAIAKADLAERQWARLPSDLIFSRKAMIYEIQAGGWQGRFYDSEGTDMDALQQAIRAWDKYVRHVQTKNRADLAVKGETQANRLRDMQSRLE